MAAVLVQIDGILWDKASKSGKAVTMVGQAHIPGLGVGGGPVLPPPGGNGGDAHPEHPIHYPPGTKPHPEHPIVLPPDPSWPGGDPHPEHPIVLPPPNLPVTPPNGTKPPPEGEGGWGYYDGRWGYFPGPGEAGPKK